MQTPEPEPVSTADALAQLEGRLDELWESYLVFLDQYTKAQHEIKCHMSAGFLALAKAQSSAPSGKRYGRDWYDERMKASQKAVVIESPITTHEGDLAETATTFPSINIRMTCEEHHGDSSLHMDGKSNAVMSNEGAEQQPSPPGTPGTKSNPGTIGEEQLQDSKLDEQNGAKTPTNPLRWYGMFTPAGLTRAQQSFSAAISVDEESSQRAISCTGSPISSAVNAARGLREVESELRKTRKALRKADKAKSAVAV